MDGLSELGALVLVVDDDPSIREVLQMLLEQAGYRAATAPNGDEALRVLPSLRPDLIVLDLCMPVLDGFAVVARTQRDPVLASIPILIYSSQIDVLPEGIAGALSKSRSLEEFLAAVKARVR